jgi:hypothetical protein
LKPALGLDRDPNPQGEIESRFEPLVSHFALMSYFDLDSGPVYAKIPGTGAMRIAHWVAALRPAFDNKPGLHHG